MHYVAMNWLFSMEPEVKAALFTALIGVGLAVGKILWDWHQKRSERRLEGRAKLDTYRAPLMAAVHDLGLGIHNIRNRHFLEYLETDRRERAVMTTLFRFAQFFGWTEIIYGYSDRLRFDDDEATKKVNQFLNDIGRTLSTDSLDRADENDFTTTRLMLWRDEQRAIGELMRQVGDEPRCIGFDSFFRSYKVGFAKWFATFRDELPNPSTAASNRFAALQTKLAQLIKELDIDEVLVKRDDAGEIVEPGWARPSSIESGSDVVIGTH